MDREIHIKEEYLEKARQVRSLVKIGIEKSNTLDSNFCPEWIEAQKISEDISLYLKTEFQLKSVAFSTFNIILKEKETRRLRDFLLDRNTSYQQKLDKIRTLKKRLANLTCYYNLISIDNGSYHIWISPNDIYFLTDNWPLELNDFMKEFGLLSSAVRNLYSLCDYDFRLIKYGPHYWPSYMKETHKLL